MQTSSNPEVAKFPTDSIGKGNFDETGNYVGTLLPTGSNDAYSVNNIYDMAGNVADTVNEASGLAYRACRGSSYMYRSTNGSAGLHQGKIPEECMPLEGCRATLYIK